MLQEVLSVLYGIEGVCGVLLDSSISNTSDRQVGVAM